MVTGSPCMSTSRARPPRARAGSRRSGRAATGSPPGRPACSVDRVRSGLTRWPSSPSTYHVKTRRPTPICGAARPAPGASSMVSVRSATRVRSSLSKSTTSSALGRSTGSPNSRIGWIATELLRLRGSGVRRPSGAACQWTSLGSPGSAPEVGRLGSTRRRSGRRRPGARRRPNRVDGAALAEVGRASRRRPAASTTGPGRSAPTTVQSPTWRGRCRRPARAVTTRRREVGRRSDVTRGAPGSGSKGSVARRRPGRGRRRRTPPGRRAGRCSPSASKPERVGRVLAGRRPPAMVTTVVGASVTIGPSVVGVVGRLGQQPGRVGRVEHLLDLLLVELAPPASSTSGGRRAVGGAGSAGRRR